MIGYLNNHLIYKITGLVANKFTGQQLAVTGSIGYADKGAPVCCITARHQKASPSRFLACYFKKSRILPLTIYI
jgi:hypothetical protein